jgi:hypothetical protein
MAPGGKQDRRRALLLAVLAFIVYNANFRVIFSGDCFPARFLPFAILKAGSLTLDPVLEAVRQGYPSPYWVEKSITGTHVSLFPIVVPVLVTPLCVPAAVVLRLLEWREPYLSMVAEVMEKVSSSVIASISVAFVFLLVRRRLDTGRAMLLSVAYAFATNTWVTGSQALWQHGTGELLIVIALLCATGELTRGRAFLVGIACALGIMNRPPDLLLFAPVLLETIVRARADRSLPRVGAAVALGLVVASAPFVAYNLAAYGLPGGGYQYLFQHRPGTHSQFVKAPLLPALAGLLFSPAKGLLFYSPFLLFLAGRLKRDPGGIGDRRFSLLLGAGVAAHVFLYSRTDWRGGYSYGPRYLVDLLPILVFLLVPVVRALERKGLVVFAVCVSLGAGIQAVGAFCYPQGMSDPYFFSAGDEDPTMKVWSLRRSPVVVEARAGIAPMKFAAYARGALHRLVRAGSPPREAKSPK